MANQPSDKELKEAKLRKPAPQHWDQSGGTDGQGDYSVNEGKNGAQFVYSRDGENETLGTTTDTPQTDPAQDATAMEVFKGQLQVMNDTLTKLTSILTQVTGVLKEGGNVNAAVTFPTSQTVAGTVTAAQGAPGAQAWPVSVTTSDVTLPVAQVGGNLGAGATYACSTAAPATPIGTAACSMVLLQSDQNNTTDILIGGAGGQSIRLTPGQPMTMPVANVNQVYARAVSGTPNLNWLPIT